MKIISKYISFTALTIFISAGSAFATELPKEGSYDDTACWSGVSNTITFSKTRTASSYELTGTTRRGRMFDKNTFRCVGAAQLASLATPGFDQSIMNQHIEAQLSANSLSRATTLNPIYSELVLKPLSGLVFNDYYNVTLMKMTAPRDIDLEGASTGGKSGGATTGGLRVSEHDTFYAPTFTGGTSGGGRRSSLPPPAGYTTSQLIFEDTFTGYSLDSTKWIPAVADQNGIWRKSVPSPYSAVNAGGFSAEYYDPAQISIGPSGLKIVATRSNRFAGYTWKSGVICTHGKFTFPGGYAQIRMKQPDVSTGGWPGFWHLEGGGEIDTQEGGFLDGSVPVNRVLANAFVAATTNQQFFDAGVDLSADYHVWGMEYIPGVSIKFYFDGVLKRTVTTNVPTGAMTLLISLSIANSSASDWRTAYDSSTPATLELDVTDVQVYRL